jgi:endonuclease/exonuclease/phosphatase family metal-dependent hydrolase
METAHSPTEAPSPTPANSLDDVFDRAQQELARAGIGFEIVSDHIPLERAA